MIKQNNKYTKLKCTIVVPIYSNAKVVGGCLESLIKFIDRRHKIIIVNDCGPEVDVLEEAVLGTIKGQSNITYHRNSKNIGFVETCNYAVNELDKSDNHILLLNSDTVVTQGFLEEMLQVLNVSDRHGVVVPRSNNATIASVPFARLDQNAQSKPEYSYSVFKKMHKDMPRFSIAPVGPGFCILIRRELIKNFGLYDGAYSPGYNEENDFCLRINSYGYSSLISNWSFVYHLESQSFGKSRRTQLDLKNREILLKRYPFYDSQVKRYIENYIDVADHFAEPLAGTNKKLNILLNFNHFPPVYNGSTVNGVSFLNYLKSLNLDKKNIHITICTSKEAVDFHRLKRFGFEIIHAVDQGRVFDVGYVPNQFFQTENLVLMNRACLKIVFSMLDIIAIRCLYLLENSNIQQAIFYDSLKLADKVIAISNFTKKDIIDYFEDNILDDLNKKIQVIALGYPEAISGDKREERLDSSVEPIIKKKYILIFGNDYTHKAIERTLKEVSGLPYNFVVLGPKNINLSKKGNVTILPSGLLSNYSIETLYKNCSVMIFPSQYEGFGIPILEAAKYKKPLIYFSSEVGEEVSKLVAQSINIYSFGLFEEIPNLIERALSEKSKIINANANLRSLDVYNQKVWESIIDVAKAPTDMVALRDRWKYFNRISDYFYTGAHQDLGARTYNINLRGFIRNGLLELLSKNETIYKHTRRAYRLTKKMIVIRIST